MMERRDREFEFIRKLDKRLLGFDHNSEEREAHSNNAIQVYGLEKRLAVLDERKMYVYFITVDGELTIWSLALDRTLSRH